MTLKLSRSLLLCLGLGLWLAIAAPVLAEEEEGVPPRAHWLIALEEQPAQPERQAEAPPTAVRAAPASPAAESARREAPNSAREAAPAGERRHTKPESAEAKPVPRPPTLRRTLASVALGLGLMAALIVGTRIILRWDRLG